MRLFPYSIKCCFGPLGCSSYCIGPLRESITTTIMYCIMLILGSIILITSHENSLLYWSSVQFNSTFNKSCIAMRAEPNCGRLKGYLAVYRIAYAFTTFHFLMSIFCLYICNSQEWRARIHNGFWFFKCLAIFLIWTLFYLLPIFEYIPYLYITFGVLAAIFFIIIQYVSIIDCAFEFNGYLLEKGLKSQCFNILLYFVTSVLYVVAVFGYVFLFLQFALPNVCVRNRVFIIINFSVSALLVMMSFFTNKQKQNQFYIPGAVVCALVSFLTWTAIKSAPNAKVDADDKFDDSDKARIVQYSKNVQVYICAPKDNLLQAALGDSLHAYLGIFIMLVTAVYYSISATIDYKRYGITPAKSKKMSLSQLEKINEDVEMQNLKSTSKRSTSNSFLDSGFKNNNKTISQKSMSMPNVSVETGKKSLETISGTKQKNVSNRLRNKRSRRRKMKGMSDNSNLAGKKRHRRAISLTNSVAKPEKPLFGKLRTTSLVDKTVGFDTVVDTTDKLVYPMDHFMIHDEYYAVRYSYSWLHFSFGLAYLFVMVQITNWYNPTDTNVSNINISMPTMWIKITTSWAALVLFGWSLLFPAFCVGRKLYEFPLTSLKRAMKLETKEVKSEIIC